MAKKYQAPAQDRFGNSIDSYEPHVDGRYCGLTFDEYQRKLFNIIIGEEKDIIFVECPAGCGKTTVSMAAAHYLVKSGKKDGVIGIMAPYGESRQGYLPGSLTEKSAVYFEPFYQALIKCNEDPERAINTDPLALQTSGKYGQWVTLITDTYLRGSNLENKVIIVDEAQNYTERQLRTIISRCHDDCKIIVCGNVIQCDLPNPNNSGFMRALNHYYIKYPDHTAVVQLRYNYRGWISSAADERWDEHAVIEPCRDRAIPIGSRPV